LFRGKKPDENQGAEAGYFDAFWGQKLRHFDAVRARFRRKNMSAGGSYFCAFRGPFEFLDEKSVCGITVRFVGQILSLFCNLDAF
jgi:hypothetical protein